ncbi:MAG: FMN-binding negative transcriptional regulator [Rhodocyclales bacterium]|nr:FMN-binding negative transcriptional regulator [Rhodocyclales bacterium]
MYLPKHFAENDLPTLHALMREHPLATVITHDAEGLDANHLPLLLDTSRHPQGQLRGHIARGNPLAQAREGIEVLVIFHGPQCYISPSGYATKAEHGKVVPTWNYCVVHAHGRLRAIDDADWLRAQVTALTANHEAKLAQPWAVSDAPNDYIDKMLSALVGVEIDIERLVGKWKVSQNQPAVNQASLQQALAGGPMADLIGGRRDG